MLPITYVVFNGVYQPSDDTFLLIDAIKNINVKNKRILEIGCGTGVISLYLAYKGAIVDAVDIDDKALENTIFNAKLNNLRIRVYRSDLFKSVKDTYDIIIFNSPYLEDNKVIDDKSIFGGTEIIMEFISKSIRYLNKDGEVYFTINDKNDYGLILLTAINVGLRLSVISRKKLFFEELYVVKGVRYA